MVRLQALRRLPFSYAPVLFAINALAALFVLVPFIAAIRRIFMRAAAPGKNLLEKANTFLTDNPRFALHLTFFSLFTAVMLSPRVKEYGYFNACIFLALVISGLSHRRAIAASVAVVLVILLTDGPHIFAQSVFHNYDQVILALSTYAIVVASLKDSFEAMRRP
jgi:glucose-6-phosphate-specific signal transduction histidine kinase